MPRKCCVTWECCCVTVDFSHAWQKRILTSEVNTSLKSLTYCCAWVIKLWGAPP
jgi:hypothetical protein